MEKKVSADLLGVLISEMRRLEAEHPKAKIYYAWEDGEIRITYPLPVDFDKFKANNSYNHSLNI